MGFVMVSWDVVPVPDELWGPYYLWRLLVDERHQGHGYGTAALGLVADAVRAAGARRPVHELRPGRGLAAALLRGSRLRAHG